MMDLMGYKFHQLKVRLQKKNLHPHKLFGQIIIISPVMSIPHLYGLIITSTITSACGEIIILPAGHVIIAVHWNVGNEAVVKTIVAVRCPKPLIKAMFQWQIMREMTEMPTIASVSVMSTNGSGKVTLFTKYFRASDTQKLNTALHC